jgi:hypothetical protein
MNLQSMRNEVAACVRAVRASGHDDQFDAYVNPKVDNDGDVKVRHTGAYLDALFRFRKCLAERGSAEIGR